MIDGAYFQHLCRGHSVGWLRTELIREAWGETRNWKKRAARQVLEMMEIDATLSSTEADYNHAKGFADIVVRQIMTIRITSMLLAMVIRASAKRMGYA